MTSEHERTHQTATHARSAITHNQDYRLLRLCAYPSGFGDPETHWRAKGRRRASKVKALLTARTSHF
eukprot:scaffold14629_cov116-Isochrysis_galbana.AAC.3